MVLKAQKTMQNLLGKGFVKSEGSHHYLEFWHNGKYVLQTFCSHNNQDINDYLIIRMKKQCHLDKDDFLDLANCPLSQEAYIKKLLDRGILSEEDMKAKVSA